MKTNKVRQLKVALWGAGIVLLGALLYDLTYLPATSSSVMLLGIGVMVVGPLVALWLD